MKLPASGEQLKTINTAASLLDYRHIRLLVWNIQKMPNTQTPSDMFQLIRTSDLALIQESYASPVFDLLVKSLSLFNVQMAQSFFDIHGISTGVASFSKGYPAFSSALQSIEREPVVKTPKMILAQTFHHPEIEYPLLVLNIHALNFVSQSEFESQIRQSMKFIRNHKGPIIYAGDFNTWNSDRLEFLKKLLSVYDLQRISLKSTSFLQLDHIFIRGFKTNSAQTLENIASSDHYPMTAELSLVTQ